MVQDVQVRAGQAAFSLFLLLLLFFPLVRPLILPFNPLPSLPVRRFPADWRLASTLGSKAVPHNSLSPPSLLLPSASHLSKQFDWSLAAAAAKRLVVGPSLNAARSSGGGGADRIFIQMKILSGEIKLWVFLRLFFAGPHSDSATSQEQEEQQLEQEQ